MNTPMNNPSINDENLILTEQKENQNININNLTIEKNTQFHEESNIFVIRIFYLITNIFMY